MAPRPLDSYSTLCIRWDGDHRYPHSTGCQWVRTRLFFPSASSTKGKRRSAFEGLREVSTTEHATLAGQQENWLRLGEWCAQPSQLQNKHAVKGFRIRKSVSGWDRYVDYSSFLVIHYTAPTGAVTGTDEKALRGGDLIIGMEGYWSMELADLTRFPWRCFS